MGTDVTSEQAGSTVVAARPRRSRAALAILALFATSLILYAPVQGHGFLAYDDPLYVTDNPQVAGGLTGSGVAWAFTSVGHASNWHPLTWLSHMLDVELFGMDAGRHHVVNVVLHAGVAALLLIWLVGARVSFGVSLFVAFAFVVHPLRVESVAWISERKDLLAGLGWFATLCAWTGYVRTPSRRSLFWCLTWLSLGLLAKPMLVSLPIVLLVLDRWPYRRALSGSHSLREKLPLVAPALVCAGLTLAAQSSSRATQDWDELSLPVRLANALRSTATYVEQTLLPHDLAVFHPHPALVGASQAAGATLACAAALLAALALALRLRRSHPFVLAGLGWFLIALAPVVGIVQVGAQGWADRYAYLPTVGLLWIGAEGGRRLVRALVSPPLARALLAVAALGVLGVWANGTRRQLGVWRDTESLFRHALRVTDRNWVAHNYVGLAELESGRLDAALASFEQALAIRPDDERARFNAALARMRGGQLDAAEADLVALLADAPGLPRGWALLGSIQAQSGRHDDARQSLEEALRQDPEETGALTNLGTLRLAADDHDGARQLFERVLELDPSLPLAAERLAWSLLSDPRPERTDAPRALRLAQDAAQRAPSAQSLATLAAALAAAGRFSDAQAVQQRALELAPAPLRADYAQRLEAFAAGTALFPR